MPKTRTFSKAVASAVLLVDAFSFSASAKSDFLLCKIDGIEPNQQGARMQPHDGNYGGLTDQGDTILVNIGGTTKVILSIIQRRDGWLLTAQQTDAPTGAKTTLHVLNLPPYDGLTMLMVLAGRNGSGVTMKGACRPN